MLLWCKKYRAYFQRLEVRVRQYVPRGIRDRTTSGHLQMSDSAICQHLNVINTCSTNYDDECFAVLLRARTKQHLNVLEAIYILLNHPSQCKQNPRYSLHLLGNVSSVSSGSFIHFFPPLLSSHHFLYHLLFTQLSFTFLTFKPPPIVLFD